MSRTKFSVLSAAFLAVFLMGGTLRPAVHAEEAEEPESITVFGNETEEPEKPEPEDSGEEEPLEGDEPVINYDLYVGSLQITSKNSDVFPMGDNGTGSYDPATNTLSLQNAKILGSFREGSSTFYGIYCGIDRDLTVVLYGTNRISNETEKWPELAGSSEAGEDLENGLVYDYDANGIYAKKGVKLAGSGSLNIRYTSNYHAIGLKAGGNIELENKQTTMDMSGRGALTGIYTDGALNLKGTELREKLSGSLGQGHIGAVIGNKSFAAGSSVEFVLDPAVTDAFGFYTANYSEMTFDEQCSLKIDTRNGSFANKRFFIKTGLTALAKDREGSQLTFNPSGYDMSGYCYLEAPYEMKTYSLVSGDQQEWKKGGQDGISFACSASLLDEDTSRNLSMVELDVKLLSSEEYTSNAGLGNKGVVISLYRDKLETLSVGTHTLTITFTDWETKIRAGFSVAEADPPAPTPPAKEYTEVYRFYNPNSGEHFYTANPQERDHLINTRWFYEGVSFITLKTSARPVFRVYNPNAGDHFYTVNPAEKELLVKAGWKDEGIAWYASGSAAQYRLYNPNAEAGAHFYTSAQKERDSLIKAGWKFEGIAFYTEE